ncbi:MAG: TonB-dependent receptor [Flavobacteriaceae bacterium]|nr:TonB-dependent receptor [Flavobacteriaceae bacterium]
MKKLTLLLFFSLMGTFLYAQTAVSGKIVDVKGIPIPGANVKVVGKTLGTTADFDGKFSLNLSINTPFSLEFSLLGYETNTVSVQKNNQVINITLSESQTVLDEVVVSASRAPERILESPVTIERMDIKAIRGTASPSFYDGLENLKGVDINSSSITFKSVNTRGFATFANTRFMQLVDGMDNSSPALNFNLGNLLGMNELDVQSVELMPGASSALYGANAFNGILFMQSKNPFDYGGVSAYVKTGITSQKAAGDNEYFDAGVRFAYKFSDKFAAKTSFSFMKGTEWFATDYKDYNNPLLTRADKNYDGLNTYGDEVSINMDATFRVPAGTLGTVSRTGYNEVDLMDYNAESAKLDVALHYRPFADDVEVIFNSKTGFGSTIYQGANRYSIKNFIMQQHKLEIKGDRFFVRGYMTTEDAGDSYDSRFTAINMQRDAKSDTNWFTDYFLAYTGTLRNPAFGGMFNAITPAPGNHTLARTFADSNLLNNASLSPLQAGTLSAAIAPAFGLPSWNRADKARFIPGTAAFNTSFDKITANPNLGQGSKFVDQSKIYHSDANYNFGDIIDFADLQVGGSWRQYSLNSNGTIFTDYDGPITYQEYGAYTQVQKKFFDDRLKLAGSLRYDKADNFDGNISPRVAITYLFGGDKTRNLRASFQTGFRNPTTQDLFIGLDVGRAFLVGSSPENLDRYTTPTFNVSATGRALGFPATKALVGRAAYDNSFSLSSVLAGAPKKANFGYVQPEKVKAFELGYRAGFGKLALDISGYYNEYEDFIGNKTVLVPLYGKTDLTDIHPVVLQPNALIALAQGDFKAFQVYTNSSAVISSYGGTLGITTKILGNYDFGINYTYAKFDFDQSTDPDYEAGFNTPENKVKVSFGNTSLFENFGFGVNYRWNDKYFWQSSFADAMVQANSVVDAQINYTIPKWKSMFKIGGSNLGGKEYVSAPGVGSIGSIYYFSLTLNP